MFNQVKVREEECVCVCVTDVCVGSRPQQQLHAVALVVQAAVVQRRVSC